MKVKAGDNEHLYIERECECGSGEVVSENFHTKEIFGSERGGEPGVAIRVVEEGTEGRNERVFDVHLYCHKGNLVMEVVPSGDHVTNQQARVYPLAFKKEA